MEVLGNMLLRIASILIVILINVTSVFALGINDGLVGWWKLDEGGGTSAYDSSGNGNVGTLNSSPGWVSGKRGGALRFTASGGYVQMLDSSSLKIPTTITVSA